MAEAKDIYGGIYQNLIDAGCDQQMTELCMTFVKEGQFSDIVPVLTRHRSWLPVVLSASLLIRPLAGRAAARYETRRHRIYLRKITVRQWIILVCSPMLTGSVLAQSAYADFREWWLPLQEQIPELKR